MKGLRKNCGGFTLVEIIVTFTLTAIFMTAAAMVLTTFMKSHTVANAVAKEQEVAATVMDTVTGELSSARYFGKPFSTSESTDDSFIKDGKLLSGDPEPGWKADQDEKCQMLINNTEGNSVIWYVDGDSDNIVKMYVDRADPDAGYLKLDYYVRKESPDVGWKEEKEVSWQLGAGVYQGCSIDGFIVKPLKEVLSEGAESLGDNSCLSVTLKLSNKMAGEKNSFTIKRALECYNLSAENIVVWEPGS